MSKGEALFRPREGKAPSSRGLFAATGNVAKEARPREEKDFYATPPEPTRAFLAAEGGRLRQFPRVWEAACGDGAMLAELRAAGLEAVGSDLVDRGCGAVLGDFFAFARPLAPAIVTNPPYDKINWRDGRGAWVAHAMGTLGVDYMALFLNWSWPGAAGLGPLWERWPPARVYLCRWKVDFTGQGAPPMLNGWFVWDRAAVGEPVLRMLDRAGDGRQAPMFTSGGEDEG